MKDTDWIDAKSACAALGVKPQTLYAYVSREKIRVTEDSKDARSSLYSRHDIESLMRQKRRPRARSEVAREAIRWGEPVLETAISEVRDGTFWIRGRKLQSCAREMTLEEVAGLLIGSEEIPCIETDDDFPGHSPFSRVMRALARETDRSPSIAALDMVAFAQEAGRMLSIVADACLGRPGRAAIHNRIADAWGLAPQHSEAVRQAIVLLCDHELNPSTFAVRICASTDTNLPSVMLAGMATLSGKQHGSASELTQQAILSMEQNQFDRFRHQHPDIAPYGFGFGHPLYPEGDPRAKCLLGLLPQSCPVADAIHRIATHVSLAPNVDAGLVGFAKHFACPPDAAKIIFAIGRSAGWMAHALEQVQSGSLIRPRARYKPLASAIT